MSEIANFKDLSIKDLFQIKGGIVAVGSGICTASVCNTTVCQTGGCSAIASNTCTSYQCITRAIKNASA